MHDFPETRRSLLVRLREVRDEAAWQEFTDIYEPLVYRLARRRGLQDADARDLCQDVLRAVAGAIERWDPDPSRGTFRGWLFRIARNLILNLLASQQRHPRGSGDTQWQEFLEHQATESQDSVLFDAEYKRLLFQRAADSIRAQFSESTWQAFWLTGIEELETSCVAERLAMTPGAVYIARSRVLARLRERVREIEGGPT